jgi:hypothetical protein
VLGRVGEGGEKKIEMGGEEEEEVQTTRERKRGGE